MRTKTKLVTAVGLAGLVAAGVNLRSGEVTAADHVDSPQSEADPAADIADLYAWHADGRLYAIITFAGLTPAGGDATYDADVLYTLHIDAASDRGPDHDVHIRVGQNLLEEWGVRVDGLPGEDASFEGPVGEVVSGANGGRVQAGLFDDPFFFDLDGFEETIMNITTNGPGSYGNLAFDSTNDSFAGTNVTAIVLDMPYAAADDDGNGQIQVWATTGRLTPR